MGGETAEAVGTARALEPIVAILVNGGAIAADEDYAKRQQGWATRRH